MADIALQLTALRALRETVTDPAQGAALDALVAQLEAATLAHSHTQTIAGDADVGVAIAGHLYGDIYYGIREKNAAQLLGGYLQRLVLRCTRIPLQGMHRQNAISDMPDMHLDQVYTKLATTTLIERESYAGQQLQQLSAKAILAAHSGAHLMPDMQRLKVRIQVPDGHWEKHFHRQQAPLSTGIGRLQATPNERDFALETLSSEELAKFASSALRLTFLGPQLVTEAIANHQQLVLLGEPGSGKSTALRYLALKLAEAGLNAGAALVEQLDGWDARDVQEAAAVFAPVQQSARP
jgi:hypothetical protein